MLQSALMNVMVKAARRAGRSLKRDLGEIENLQVSLKGPANFVSLADKRAEDILYEELSKARPGYGFFGEEGGNRVSILACEDNFDDVPQGALDQPTCRLARGRLRRSVTAPRQ